MRNWKKWLKAAAIRAVKTVAQTAVATIGTSAVLGEVNWAVVASASALAGVLSLLTSVAGLPEEKPNKAGKRAPCGRLQGTLFAYLRGMTS